MHTHLYHMITRQRDLEQRRAAERARLASDVSGRERNPRGPAPVTQPDGHSRRVRSRDTTALEVERAGWDAR